MFHSLALLTKEMTACSLVLPENPLAEYVELPANLTNRLRLGFPQKWRWLIGGQFWAPDSPVHQICLLILLIVPCWR